MMKKMAIQLVFIIVIIAYLIYHNFNLQNINGVIITIMIGLWVLATVMMVTLDRSKRS
ncbi:MULTISPECIES: hypothetical protein [Kurthia]|uniref:Uncharacterized protein n=1 Tax=Kurthia populi TaxID=1562132 RepID=A0ABW5XY05_9BACL|nr:MULTISPECIES: hypothetical protein [unclassified Kurthia]HIX42199.1 hypothetical protein [Candidatus Kurthia intestinigallinarum]